MHSIQLSIPTPCHQNWDKMTPTEQGRFCNACAKQVVDFTTMSDGEVLNFFINKKEENVCGRTLPNQLNRILEAPKPIVPSKLWYWKYAAAAGLLFINKNAQAQITNTITPPIYIQQALRGRVGGLVIVENIQKVISGQITDADNRPIPFLSIRIKGTPFGVGGDDNGNFSIKVDCTKDILQISSSGYEPKEIDLKNCTSYNFNLKRDKRSLKGEIVVGNIGMMNVTSQSSIIYKERNVAVINVKDSATQKTISDVKLYFKEEDDAEFKNVLLKNGAYKIKDIKKDEIYTIQASKEGYVSKAIEISSENFNSRKGVFEIYLIKKENDVTIRGNTFIRMGGVTSINKSTEPLYVIDGTPILDFNAKTFNTNLIENINVLKASSAQAIFGSIATNGAIIITTKKQKVKKDTLSTHNYKLMDEVVVKGDTQERRINTRTMGAVYSIVNEQSKGCGVGGVTIVTNKIDTINQKIQNLFSPLKVFPNPIKKGELLTLSFPNKNKNYTIQIINAAGVVVLQNKRQDGLKPSDAYIQKNTITQQLPIAHTWSSGYYFINILNEQGKPIAKSSFLVL